MNKSIEFTNKKAPRYWWHRIEGADYVPPIYSTLEEKEWGLMEKWYKDTTNKNYIGEIAVPFMSVLQGFIMGNNLKRIVQLGHYAGYSSLLLGFYLRKMNKKQSLFSLDIDEEVSKYTNDWIAEAKLEEYVRIHVGNSTSESSIKIANTYFSNEKPEIVIIDASHQYEQTLVELDIWYELLSEKGFIFLHDSSKYAARFDRTQKGGVNKAIKEWTTKNNVTNVINITNFSDSIEDLEDEIYKDPCGICIIQK